MAIIPRSKLLPAGFFKVRRTRTSSSCTATSCTKRGAAKHHRMDHTSSFAPTFEKRTHEPARDAT